MRDPEYIIPETEIIVTYKTRRFGLALMRHFDQYLAACMGSGGFRCIDVRWHTGTRVLTFKIDAKPNGKASK